MFLKSINNLTKIQFYRFNSSLTAAFNCNKYAAANRKYANEKITGLFDIIDLKDPPGLFAMRYKSENDCHILLKEALSQSRNRKIVEILDDMSDSICQVADLAECMRLLHPDESMRTICAQTCQTMSKLVESLNTNYQLFSILDKVVKSGIDVLPLDDIDLRVSKLLHSDFEASGIHLHSDTRKKFVNATQTSFEIASQFFSETESPVKLSASVLSTKLQKKLKLTPNQSIEVSHAYSYTDDSSIREVGYRLFFRHNPQQEELLRCLMESRLNVAQFAGFQSYSERANIHSICENPSKIIEFLTGLSTKLLPFSEIDRIKLLKLKYGNNFSTANAASQYELLPWDISFLTNSLKDNSLPGGYQNYCPYFSLGNCMEGINALLSSQFGLKLEVEETLPGELWHPDVFKVNVSHHRDGHLGVVYCDMFARDHKPATDCHYTIRAGKSIPGGDYQSPIVVLHSSLCTVTPNNSLTLLNPPAVETLFHEWGHAIHSILARTRYQHVSGTRCGTDLAEAPSTLMEHFALDSRVVKEYSRHHRTHVKIPENMIYPLSQQKYVCSSIDHQLTIINSMFDQIIHGKDLPLSSSNSATVYDSISHNHSLLPGSKAFDRPSDSKNIYWPHRFGHLVNYGAKYYSYLMSNCISGFLWRSTFHSDPWSSSFGEHYRNTVLQHGGEMKPLNLIANFSKSKEITIETLVDGFVEDIAINYNK